MSNSEKTITFTVPEETYNRITKIKNHLNCTYSEVVAKLVELELKNNYIIEINDYVFVTEKSEGYFRILIRNDDNIFQYLTRDGYAADITRWDIPDKDKNIFKKFISDPTAMILLENMQVSMEFKDFVIFRE